MKCNSRSKEDLYLAPMPAEVKLTGGFFKLPAEISLSEESPSALSRTVRRELSARAVAADAATVRLLGPNTAPAALKGRLANPEGYGLRIDGDGICIWAASGAGHLYGAMTLRQLIRQCGHRLPHLLISDAPAFQSLGGMFLPGEARTRWYGDREHEWAAENPRFLRYTTNEKGPWRVDEVTQRKE